MFAIPKIDPPPRLILLPVSVRRPKLRKFGRSVVINTEHLSKTLLMLLGRFGDELFYGLRNIIFTFFDDLANSFSHAAAYLF